MITRQTAKGKRNKMMCGFCGSNSIGGDTLAYTVM